MSSKCDEDNVINKVDETDSDSDSDSEPVPLYYDVAEIKKLGGEKETWNGNAHLRCLICYADIACIGMGDPDVTFTAYDVDDESITIEMTYPTDNLFELVKCYFSSDIDGLKPEVKAQRDEDWETKKYEVILTTRFRCIGNEIWGRGFVSMFYPSVEDFNSFF